MEMVSFHLVHGPRKNLQFSLNSESSFRKQCQSFLETDSLLCYSNDDKGTCILLTANGFNLGQANKIPF